MLTRQARVSGFSIIAVTGALTIIGLLTMAAWSLVQDHSRRAALSADHTLALSEAERALEAAECEIAIATNTPHSNQNCHAKPDPARVAALNPVTLSGFTPGKCGSEAPVRGLCWPSQNESATALAGLVKSTAHAVPLDPANARGGRNTTPPRYIIEPIPDALPGQWIHASAPRAPSLFRITAVGFGSTSVNSGGKPADALVNVMLQTVYRPRVVEQ